MEDDNQANGLTPEQNILYEILVYSEWKQEPELPKVPTEPSDGLKSLISNTFSYFRRPDVLSESVGKLLNWQQPWRLAVGDGGKVIALIQDGSLEIRTSRDEYSSVIGKAALPKDPYPQWRRWCWSPDCSILAVGFSNGCIRAYDLMGSNLFTIPSPKQQDKPMPDTSQAFAACFFIQARVRTHKWSSELVTVDYNGELHSYLVSPTEGYQDGHSFSFGRYYRLGVTTVSYHQSHSLLFVAGPTGARNDPRVQEHASGVGITAWRILNDHPFYQLVLSNDKNASGFLPDSLWNRLPSLQQKLPQSIVVRMEVSPVAKLLAALHSCGGVSIWHLPGLRHVGFWPLLEQPGWNVQNPSGLESLPTTNGKKPPNPNAAGALSVDNFFPIDLDWWSNEALVLSRNCGAVSVCDVTTLQNLLGESPEFLAGAAQVRRFHNEKGSLALECEVELVPKNRDELSLENVLHEQDDGLNESSDEEGEPDQPAGFLRRFSVVLSTAVYLVTDMERFRPRRKRLRLFRRTYRLLALRSTTPEELYSRKLDNEEYGEALNLAHTYNLDCDLVYQRQWRNSKVSVATIRDYLGKVSKRTWVLRECVERVPDSLLAARELNEFGLKATSKEVLRELGGKRKVRDAEDFTEEQRELLKFRRTLLHYQDCLATYEKILGGPQLADELFEHTIYADLRSASSLRACVQFARAANSQAVECMLTYHGKHTLQHWLPVLSNFPETVCPTEFKPLLPELSADGSVFPWKELPLRDADWSEKDPYSTVKGQELDTPEEDNECLYQHEPGLSAYRAPVENLTDELVQQWYIERIRAIERSSKMVDNAIVMLRLAQDHNVQGLESLLQELQTLDALVYELFLEDASLADLEKKTPSEKCKLLMSKTTEETLVSDFNRLLFPFLDRIDKNCPGVKQQLLHDYLVGIASQNLALPLQFFEQLHDLQLSEGLSNEDLISLAVSCMYAYVDTDQLHLAQRILATVPAHRGAPGSAVEQLDVLEVELNACLILQRNQTPKSLGYIRDNKHDVHTVTQLLTRMSRTVANSTPPPTEAGWSALLNDILDLNHSVFTSIPITSCYEIYCSTLLASADYPAIKLAGAYLDCGKRSPLDTSSPRIPKDKSIAIILAAAREYMDSAGSLTDPAMELAKACLHLMADEEEGEGEGEELQEELNLVSSFQLLIEFGISMLPLQVRLCPDRLRLIEDCLKKKPGAHRNANRLLQLAAYLNICGNDSRQRQGQVLVLVAESALSVNDWRCCAEICQRIVTADYAPGWQVVSQLGRCAQFKDLALRENLLAFALQYCPSEMLQELISIRCGLEVESLQHTVKKQLVMHNAALTAQLEETDTPSPADSGGLDILQTLQIGESTVRETTHRLLSRVGDKHFWKKAFQIGWDTDTNDGQSKKVVPLSRHTCHTFYASLYDSTPFYPSVLGPQYDSFSAPDIPPRLELEQALLRISLLEQGSGLEQQDLSSVLTECAQSLLPEDNCLGLAHLLTLPETIAVESSRQVFEANVTSHSLQLAQYHAAIMECRSLLEGDDESQNKLHAVLLHNPNEVISRVIESDGSSKIWKDVLQMWRARLADYVQGQELLQLGCGVDVDRFSAEAQYRHDSILGLAMSEETERLQFALALAMRHNIERSQVISEHVTALLLSDLPTDQIAERLESGNFQNLMQEAAEDVKSKLELMVLPALDGKQTDHLELYYTVLNLVAPNYRSGRLLPRDHVKLISKVKATSAVIDYKQLVSGPKNTQKAVEMSLTPENIPLVAKLLKAMPGQLASSLSVGQLYIIYLKKKLFYDSKKSGKQEIDDLLPLLKEIPVSELVDFMESICFPGDTPDETVPLQTADLLLEASVQRCDRAGDSDRAVQAAQWRDHVRKSRRLLDKWPNVDCCRSFYESQGHCETLVQIVKSTLLSNEVSLDVILDIISAASPQCSITVETCLTDLLQEFSPESETHEKLDNVILRMEQLISLGTPPEESWDQSLHKLATQDSLPPELQLRVLNLLQSIKVEDKESNLLIPHTRAIVASAWPKATWQTQDITEEDKRVELFFKLLQTSETWPQKDALRQLLDLWPPFSSKTDRNIEAEIYHRLLFECILWEKGAWSEEKGSYIVDICNRHALTYDGVEELLSKVAAAAEDSEDEDDAEQEEEEEEQEEEEKLDIDVQLLILVCLLCDDPQSTRKAVSIAQQRLMVPLYDRVAELALSKQLVVDLLPTPAYSELLSLSLVSQPSSTPSIIKALRNRNYIAEVGSVILRSVSAVPTFMRTFSAAVDAGLEGSNNVGKDAKEGSSKDVRIKQVVSLAQTPPEQSVSPDNNGNDWDVSDEEWSNVEGPSVSVKEETAQPTSESVVVKLEQKNEAHSAPLKEEHKETMTKHSAFSKSESDPWNNPHDGWDNWSDEDKDIKTENTAPDLQDTNMHSKAKEDAEGAVEKAVLQGSSKLTPSAHSAFARVPQRDNSRESSRSSVSPTSESMNSPKHAQANVEVPASSSWEDDKWDEDW